MLSPMAVLLLVMLLGSLGLDAFGAGCAPQWTLLREEPEDPHDEEAYPDLRYTHTAVLDEASIQDMIDFARDNRAFHQ